MSDSYPADSVISQWRRAVAVTPSDSVSLPSIAKALYVGGGGNVAVLHADDTVAVVYANVPAGTVLPVRARRVDATGTTATLIVAGF